MLGIVSEAQWARPKFLAEGNADCKHAHTILKVITVLSSS